MVKNKYLAFLYSTVTVVLVLGNIYLFVKKIHNEGGGFLPESRTINKNKVTTGDNNSMPVDISKDALKSSKLTGSIGDRGGDRGTISSSGDGGGEKPSVLSVTDQLDYHRASYRRIGQANINSSSSSTAHDDQDLYEYQSNGDYEEDEDGGSGSSEELSQDSVKSISNDFLKYCPENDQPYDDYKEYLAACIERMNRTKSKENLNSKSGSQKSSQHFAGQGYERSGGGEGTVE